MAPQGGLEASYFSEKAQQDLLQLFDNISGKKNLVLERALVGPIELLVKFSTLREYGVDRIFFLENDNVDSSQKNVVFLASGEKANSAQTITSQIKRLQRTADTEYDFSLIWTPRRTLVCEKILEEAGVLGDVTSLEFPLYFQPLEKDVLSLELPDAFSELYLRNDPTCVFLSARALTSLQQHYGIIPRILGKGDNAHRLAKLLSRMRSELLTTNSKPLAHSNTVDSLIILDRSVDFPSVLLTQLTYEGLIDENFGIRGSQVDLPTTIAGAAATGGAQNSQTAASSNTDTAPLKRRVQLSSSDSIYSQLRSTNFSHTGTILSRMARRLQADYEARHTSATTAELRAFVSKLPSYQADQASLKLHTSLTEEILKSTRSEIFSKTLEVQQNIIAGTAGLSDSATLREIVEDLIARDVPVATILRLLCLESCIMGGLKARDFETFRRLVVQAYGYEHVLTLDALEKMQLLVPRAGGFSIPGVGLSSSNSTGEGPERTNYSAIRRPLSLILDDVDEGDDPSDVAYVFSGYAPLSVRLVQCIVQPTYLRALSAPGANRKSSATNTATADSGIVGWKAFGDALAQIRGRTFDEILPVTDRGGRARETLTKPEERTRQGRTTVVFFLGGVTYAEVAALRLVEKRLEASGRKLMIATTGMLGGDGCVGAAIKTAPVKPE